MNDLITEEAYNNAMSQILHCFINCANLANAKKNQLHNLIEACVYANEIDSIIRFW